MVTGGGARPAILGDGSVVVNRHVPLPIGKRWTDSFLEVVGPPEGRGKGHHVRYRVKCHRPRPELDGKICGQVKLVQGTYLLHGYQTTGKRPTSCGCAKTRHGNLRHARSPALASPAERASIRAYRRGTPQKARPTRPPRPPSL